jgi:gas vesicle protein
MNEATKTFHTAAGAATDAAKGARGGLLSAVKSVVEVATLLRGLGAEEVLQKIGLMRKRTPLGSLGVFATGVAVGAGLGLLFAPMTGRQTRSYVRDRLRDVSDDVKTTTVAAVDQVEEKVEEALDNAEDAILRPDEPEVPKVKKARRHAAHADKMAS